MAEHKPILVIDENDQAVGAAPLDEVWRKGLWHRIVRVMVEDQDGRILLQKRSPHMGLFPNCWDHSAAGHVDEGDTYEQAAARELEEELGIRGEKLEEVAYYQTTGEVEGRILNRYNKLYRVRVKNGAQIKPDPHEVSEVRWFTLDEVKALIADHPNQVTDGLKKVMQEYYP